MTATQKRVLARLVDGWRLVVSPPPGEGKWPEVLLTQFTVLEAEHGERIHWQTQRALADILGRFTEPMVWETCVQESRVRVLRLTARGRARAQDCLTYRTNERSPWRQGPLVSTKQNWRRHRSMYG